jgi:hypothetical protein
MSIIELGWNLIQQNSSGIQSVTALIGLAILAKYALDTRSIAKASLEQSRSMLLPYLSICIVRVDCQQDWHIKNMGSGPALNILYSLELPDVFIPQKAPIMAGESRLLCSADGEDRARLGEALRTVNGLEISYDSLSGEHLKSRFRQDDATGAIKAEFVRGL